jgi:F420-dependent oxidoreductase-like protein
MAAGAVRFGIKVAQMGGLYEQMREAWLEADRLGFDTAWGHDHLLNQNDLAAPEDEGWTALAALLALSSRIRGGLMVTANTFRQPAVLAKMCTTVDRLSGGRLEVGLGAGWLDPEHSQFGIELPPIPERLQRLDEACQVMIALWTNPNSDFAGRHYQLHDAQHEPKPVQRPHPPIVIGGSGEKVTMRIAAKYAAEWNMSKGTPEEFVHKCQVLDEHCRAIGRDPATIQRSIQFSPEAMQGDLAGTARDFVEAGADHLVFTCPIPYSAEGARWLWHDVVGKVRPVAVARRAT